MKNEMLEATKEFKVYFLDKYPNVENPVQLISNFNHDLNEYAQESTEPTETVTFITQLLSNPGLEAFAAADFKKTKLHGQLREQYEQGDHRGDDEDLNKIADRASQDATEIEVKANEVVYGTEDLAGLRELVNELIAELE